MKTALMLALIVLCSSCWRMPQDDDVSVLPQTNNPSLTHQDSSAPWMPSVDY